MATTRVFLYFRTTRGDKETTSKVYGAWFEVVDQGTVSNFPILLGQPFIRQYGVNACYDTEDQPTDNPFATIQGQRVDLQRGSLLQFSSDKNMTWIIDSMRTKLGKSVYITDSCTRLRACELSDQMYGGLTGAAVRAVILMRLVSQGSAERILFDEGTEFNNTLFRKRVVLEDGVDQAVSEFLATEADSDINELDMVVKRELLTEHCFQINSTPILGTALSPYNLSSGGVGQGIKKYHLHDIALHTEDPLGVALEAYVDGDFAEELEERLGTASRVALAQTPAPALVEISGDTHAPSATSCAPAQSDCNSTCEVEFQDKWKKGKKSRRQRELDGNRKWLGRTVFKKTGGMFVQQFLRPEVQPSEDAVFDDDLNRETEFSDGNVLDRAQQWQQRFQYIHDESEELIDEQLQKAKEKQSTYESWPVTDKTVIHLGAEDRLFENGQAHAALSEALKDCASTMRLQVAGGQVFLTPAGDSPVSNVERAYDFSVIPQINDKLGTKSRHHGKMMNSDGLCYLFSQMLNGKPIKESLNNKDSRDIDYVVTAVEVSKNKLHSPSLYKGNSIIVRWGDNLPPEFVSTDAETWSPAEDFWVARLFYEVTHDAHEKTQLYTAGAKSSALEVDAAAAEKFGFQSYYIPSVRSEVQAVMKRGIFGRTAKRKDISASNVITSRLVVVIKIDLGTGQVSRIKSRWVSRGFEDKRFGKGEEGLNCRSHTMSDTSFLFLMQFCQATRNSLWYGDIKEAFLKGMKFQEAHGEDYHKNPYSEVWMTVPKVIQQMSEEFGLSEVVELLASIYGCKDAPANWQRTFHSALKTLQLRQSLIDPCLWVSFATPAERRVIEENRVDEYYWEQVRKIDELQPDNIEGAAAVICGGDQELPQASFPPSTEAEYLNPKTAKLADSMTMHFKQRGAILGAMGSHVDDTASGGTKLFMLRLYALFRKFPLGSFGKLAPGTRDIFIGRETYCVPAGIEQHQLNNMLEKNKQALEEHDIQVSSFASVVSEEQLLLEEKTFGLSRDQRLLDYPTAPSVPCTAEDLFRGCSQEQEVVYVVSQESYTSKIRTIDQEEVEKYIIERNRAKTKWQKKNVANPFRGRVGELIWLTKANGLIAECVSELAGQLIAAENATCWQDVQFYVNDLNGLILLAQDSESSSRRIARLGSLHEHSMFGCADAAKKRVGGTINLAGPASRRFSTLSQFSKLPKRVFNSSTGVELLAQRMLNAELMYATQIALDLHLTSLAGGVLQLVDNKNIVTEPNEKNLRLDFFALQQLKEEGVLTLVHIPGALNWADPLTKAIRDVIPELLYLGAVWGISDDRVQKVIQDFVERKLRIQAETEEENQEEKEVELREMRVQKPEKEAETGVCCFQQGEDYWIEDEQTVTRVHVEPRKTRFTPKTKEFPTTREDTENWNKKNY
eukprot:g18292.t1